MPEPAVGNSWPDARHPVGLQAVAHGDPDADRVRRDDRDDDCSGGIVEEPGSEDGQLHGRRHEHRPDGLIDAAGRVDARVQHLNRQPQGEFGDHQKRVEAADRIHAGQARQQHGDSADDDDRQGGENSEDHPAADLLVGGVAVPGPGERPQAVPHDLQKSPPAAGDDQASRPQHHHRECGDPAEGVQQDEELGHVDGEPDRRHQEGKPKPVTEVTEDPAGEEARVQRYDAVVAVGCVLVPAVQVVHVMVRPLYGIPVGWIPVWTFPAIGC